MLSLASMRPLFVLLIIDSIQWLIVVRITICCGNGARTIAGLRARTLILRIGIFCFRMRFIVGFRVCEKTGYLRARYLSATPEMKTNSDGRLERKTKLMKKRGLQIGKSNAIFIDFLFH